MKVTFQNQYVQTQQEAYKRQHPEAELPDSYFRELMDEQLGRGYLNHMSPPGTWEMEPAGLQGTYGWLRFARLPIRPGKEEENTLLESWQSVLSACHTMLLRVAFVLLRRKGQTEIYLGACAHDGNTGRATEQLRQCMAIHMPGAELQPPKAEGMLEDHLAGLPRSGVVTGIPSLRSDSSGVTLQTLDKLARGIRIGSKEQSYALVVMADPAADGEIVELQQTFLSLKSEIHQFAGYSSQESVGRNEGENTSKTGSLDVGALMECLIGDSLFGRTGFSYSKGKSSGFSTNSGVTREFRDFTAKYCEDLIDRNVSRLERGRNLGFWQTGVYVLSENDTTTDAVLGMLRSVYSGRESYVEPIRVFNTGANDYVSDYVSRFQFLPLPGTDAEKRKLGEELGLSRGWHVLGRMYESFTTALTTEELSIASSLPRREVPGLRMVKNAVHFANNTAGSPREIIDMGQLVDMGVPQQTRYGISPHAIVRHMLVCGSTGTGKSTTCKKIINGVRDCDIPVMIIEPAKDDYVRWAIEQNRSLPDDQKYTIIMPGVSQIDGVEPDCLWLNLFQPAAWGDAPVNLVQHAEMIVTLLNACLPSEDVIPVLIEEAVHECLEYEADKNAIDLTEVDNPQMEIYPTLQDLKEAGDRVVERKTYEKRTKENFREILNTRFHYLMRGTRGRILDVPLSTDYDKLFSRPVVINLSRLSGSKDKSLVMSLLLLALQEYRISRYQYDAEYRAKAQKNELLHLVVVEEAHNVLTKPVATGSGNPQQAAAELFGNMLSEIRSYGQGMMIVDQVPTRLIDDALKNTNYKIAHRMTAPDDIDVMATAMMLRPDQAEVIPSLEIGNAIICGDMDDAAAWLKVDRN